MRILIHEFVSGGGLVGRDVPPSLAREGSAILTALVADLAAIRPHDIVTTRDARFPLAAPSGVEVVTLSLRASPRLDALIDAVDAVWLIAPESDRCLERLAAKVERKGKALLGPGSAAIRAASNKARLPQHLARHEVPHPTTRVLRSGVDHKTAAREIGYPVVVKPARGAGCLGVSIARDGVQLRRALDMAHQVNGTGPLLLQRYVAGVPASVSLLADGRRAVPLALNAQWVRPSPQARHGRDATTPPWQPLSYGGGKTPLAHPLAERALVTAVRTCESLPGLRGYIGVDLVLTKSDAIVIEVNPRLTTAYLGARAAFEDNIAELALAACEGVLPHALAPRHGIRFTSSGRILSVVPLISRNGVGQAQPVGKPQAKPPL